MNALNFWDRIFKFGLLGFAAVAFASLLNVFSFSIGVHDGVISEGRRLTKLIGVGGFWVFVSVGLALLTPAITYLYRSSDRAHRARRVAWAILIVLFPFVTTYFFFGLVIRSRKCDFDVSHDE